MAALPVYLDYNATTPVATEVISAITLSLENNWANPSSNYLIGVQSKKIIEEHRQNVANMLAAKHSDDIIFTSGGTEANKLAIDSVVYHRESSCSGSESLPHVITSIVEHCSVLNVLSDLEKRRHIDLSVVPVSKETGAVEVDTVFGSIRSSTRLISIMHANNETGVIMPISEIGSKLHFINEDREQRKLPKIFFHTDAAQTIGKIPVDVNKLHVDYLTVVGHKFYGPRIGALYARGAGQISPIRPCFLGGNQEKGLRAGTENTCMIVGLGVAANLVSRNLADYKTKMADTRNILKSKLLERISGFQVNFDGHDHLPNTLSVAVPPGQTGASVLKSCGDVIYASLGAACHSNSHKAGGSSSILTQSGLTHEQAQRTIRLSLGRNTSEKEIQAAVDMFASVCAQESNSNTFSDTAN